MSTTPTTAPVQALLIVDQPAPVTVTAPNTDELVKVYTDEILPLAKYTITTPAEYVQGNVDWTKAKSFSTSIDKLFAEPCDLAHKAWKSLTTLRSQLKAPADQIAAHVGGELIRFRNEQERLRQEEERRLQAEQEQRRREEQAELDRQAALRRQEAEAARAQALADVPEWERDEEAEPVAEEELQVILPPVAPVRIASTVPVIAGGPRMVDKRWSAEVTNPVALLKWILEKPEERIADCIEFRMPWFNKKAAELGADLENVIPGTKAERGQTLKRR